MEGKDQTGQMSNGVKSAAGDLGWMAYFAFLYHILLFQTIAGTEYIQSAGVLLGLTLLFLVIRNVFYKDANIFVKMIFRILPFGTYNIIAYYIFFPTYISIMSILVILLCLGYLFFLILQSKKRRRRKRNSLKRQASRYILGVCLIAALGSSTVMSAAIVKTLLDKPALQAPAEAVSGISGEYTLDNKIKEIIKLYDGSWGTMSVNEKLQVAQVLANIEANYLGIPYKLIACAETLETNTYGEYDERNHRININVNILLENDPDSFIVTICHEAYHAFEYEMIALFESVNEKQKHLMVFEHVPRYIKEFSAYVSGEDDFDAYSTQKVEMDAAAYAEQASKKYQIRCEEYLKRESSHSK